MRVSELSGLIKNRFDESIINKPFGDLTVLDTGVKYFPSAPIKYCLVKCKCENTYWIQLTTLINAELQNLNCGKHNCHPQVRKLLGKKFGRLTVISYGARYLGYNCICDCGKSVIARGWALKNGKHSSCGCLAIEKQVARQTKPNFEALKNEIFKNYHSASKRKNYEFSLSKEEFFMLLSGNCHYCGIAPCRKWSGTKRTVADMSAFRYNGIDRQDNNTGYITSNCVSCCHRCNNSKKDMSITAWLEWIKRVSNYQLNQQA